MTPKEKLDKILHLINMISCEWCGLSATTANYERIKIDVYGILYNQRECGIIEGIYFPLYFFECEPFIIFKCEITIDSDNKFLLIVIYESPRNTVVFNVEKI